MEEQKSTSETIRRGEKKEWATSKFYNEVWKKMSVEEKMEYADEHGLTICEIEEHHYMLSHGL